MSALLVRKPPECPPPLCPQSPRPPLPQCLCCLNSTKNVMGRLLASLPHSLINSGGWATPGEVFWSKEPHKSRLPLGAGHILCKKVCPRSATGRGTLLQAAPLIIESGRPFAAIFYLKSENGLPSPTHPLPKNKDDCLPSQSPLENKTNVF